jgi:hypothetical protein
MAQVIIGHVIFIASNLGVDSQRIHVKIASIESPVVLLIALYVWYGSRPLLKSWLRLISVTRGYLPLREVRVGSRYSTRSRPGMSSKSRRFLVRNW